MQIVGLLVFTYFTGSQGVPNFPDPDCRTDDEHSGQMFGSGVVSSQSMSAAFRHGTQPARTQEAVVYMVCMRSVEGAEC
jgi:hypothetical protein